MAFVRIKDGKYRQLVESYRDDRGRVRQRYIRTLGQADKAFDDRQDRAYDSAMRQGAQSDAVREKLVAEKQANAIEAPAAPANDGDKEKGPDDSTPGA